MPDSKYELLNWEQEKIKENKFSVLSKYIFMGSNIPHQQFLRGLVEIHTRVC